MGTASSAMISGCSMIWSPWKPNSSTTVVSSAASEIGCRRASSPFRPGRPARDSTLRRRICASTTGTTRHDSILLSLLASVTPLMVYRDGPCSPAPSMPVGKYYSARRQHFPLDVPAQCCGVSLSTLTQEDRQMATPGQPTSYKPEHCELAHNCCLLGATNEVLGDFFGVTSRTIHNWIATHPDFAHAVRRGRAVAPATVVRALFDRACGFSHQVARSTLYRGKEQTVTNTVSYPPD